MTSTPQGILRIGFTISDHGEKAEETASIAVVSTTGWARQKQLVKIGVQS